MNLWGREINETDVWAQQNQSTDVWKHLGW